MLTIDLHTHTLASGHAFNTLYELAREAEEKGLVAIAITEHGPAMAGAPHPEYFLMSSRVPGELFGVRILSGCEANIVAHDGRLDLPDEILHEQDVVLVGLHELTSYPPQSSVADNTRAILRAMENPHVDIVAHPYRPEFPTRVEQLVEAACALGVLLEVNVALFRRRPLDSTTVDQTRRMIEMLEARGRRPVVSTDAHLAQEMGDDGALQEAGIDLAPGDRWSFASGPPTRLAERLSVSPKGLGELISG